MAKTRMPKFGAARDKTEKPMVKHGREVGLYIMIISQPGKPDLLIYNPAIKQWFVADSKSKGGKKTDAQKKWLDEIGADAIAFPETTEQLLTACGISEVFFQKIPSIHHRQLSVATFLHEGRYMTSGAAYVSNDGAADKLSKVVYSDTYEEAKAAHTVMVAKALNVRDFNSSWED